ncbi:hypothetical protein OF83DRAFT_1175785 [Amylostereum chailletii]|nr:hypothetical protein OF83DRAFT_1175785 [Amylostereum chailletii]
MFYYEGDDTRQTKAASITVLETAVRLHQFQRITDLHLLAESDFQPVRSWPELFAPGWAQHVKDIKLVNRVGPRCIWEILGPPPPSAHIRSPVLFPKLRELHLSDIAFWRPDARAGSNNTAERAELLPALERYSSLGRRLNAIVIRNCECRWLWINGILRWGPVKWDRVQCSERLSMERHRVPLPNNGVVPEDNYHALYDQSVPRFSLEVIKKAPSEPWP